MTKSGKTRSLFILAGLAMLLALPAYAITPEESFQYRWIPVGMHVSTTVSDGSLSLDEVVDAAAETGLKALVVTDRYSMRWEYGLWPFQRLIRKEVEQPSISTYGSAKYLQGIALLSRKYQDLILIPGAEVAPFYYWTGFPFMRSLKINDWHRHVLVVGLTEPDDYMNLPVVAHPSSLGRDVRWYDIFRFFPLAMIALGVLAFFKRECCYADEGGRECGRFSLRWRIGGVVVALLGAFFIANENPFFPIEYDSFSRNAGYRPYQRLAEYVGQRGGLTFWAHPEAENISERDNVAIATAAHPEAIVETPGITGFAIFSEGFKVVGRPGGTWDDALRAYCRGERSRPVWAVAGMSFDQGSPQELRERMRGARTYVLANALNWHDISDGLRNGRMYATVGVGEKPLLLHSFSILDSTSGVRAISGQEFIMRGTPIITLTASVEGYEEELAQEQEKESQEEAPKVNTPPGIAKVKGMVAAGKNAVKVKLLRGSQVIKEEVLEHPAQFLYIDSEPPEERTYYRAVLTKGAQIIVTNPIFVRIEEVEKKVAEEEEEE